MAVLAAVALLSACFSYVPAEFEAVPAGEDIRIYLTRQGLAELGDIRDEDGPFLKGTLLRREGDRLFVRVPVANRQVGFFTERIGQDVPVRTSEIIQLERRRLDRVGTGLLVGGTAAAAAAVVVLIIKATGREDVIEPPPPDELRIPLLSIRIR
jgi:hypothetical protein